MKRLEGKTAIITGGSKGIGFGIATAFAKQGANLTITGRGKEALQAAKEKLESAYGAKVVALACDGSDEDKVKAVVADTVEAYGTIDILVNNASASKSGVMFEDHTTEDFDLAIYSGLYATFFFMREAFPYLKENKGSVINFASGAGLSGLAGQASYAAAKEGIRGLSRVAAREWGPYEIRVNVVCPLAMSDGLAQWKEEYPEAYEDNVKDVPLGRFGDPEKDIASLVSFLASDEASYITGQTINADGGGNLRP